MIAALFLLATAISLAELAGLLRIEAQASALAGKEAALAHVVMNGTMAVMATPVYDHALHYLAIKGFAVALAVAVLRLLFLIALGRGVDRKARLIGSGYHALGLAAMLYALALMPMVGPICGEGPRPPALALALVGVFAIDAAATASVAVLRPTLMLGLPDDGGMPRLAGVQFAALTDASDRAEIARLRLVAVPHVVMDLGMVAMLAFPAMTMG